ncbi:hypothetical protein [Azospirillum sp.]|uniref:hypothetical protein n=1 Tax=Azospirillum sp. TaxID=34012 RepID=UPI002D312B2D|nr:hypothetical protein [Azospirillum sp.]HYD66625.1 hypothetical protein [Azospirillum sp.]
MKILRSVIFATAALIAACQTAQAGEKVFQNRVGVPLNVELVVRQGELRNFAPRFTINMGSQLLPNATGRVNYGDAHVEAIRISGGLSCEIDARNGGDAEAALNNRVFIILVEWGGGCAFEPTNMEEPLG